VYSKNKVEKATGGSEIGAVRLKGKKTDGLGQVGWCVTKPPPSLKKYLRQQKGKGGGGLFKGTKEFGGSILIRHIGGVLPVPGGGR